MSICHKIRLLAAVILLLPLFSCTTRINGSLSSTGSAALIVDMSLEPRITNLIRSLTAAAGQTDNLILDGNSIANSMSNAPGIASVFFQNTAPAAIEGNINISSVSRNNFVVFEKGRCRINLDRNTSPAILELLSTDISDYLNALMAPIATGEEMTKAEYLELTASFYSKAISDEIAGSRIRASIEFPSQITSVRGGTFSGRRADFDIPLLDLLVLETPVILEVQWR